MGSSCIVKAWTSYRTMWRESSGGGSRLSGVGGHRTGHQVKGLGPQSVRGGEPGRSSGTTKRRGGAPVERVKLQVDGSGDPLITQQALFLTSALRPPEKGSDLLADGHSSKPCGLERWAVSGQWHGPLSRQARGALRNPMHPAILTLTSELLFIDQWPRVWNTYGHWGLWCLLIPCCADLPLFPPPGQNRADLEFFPALGISGRPFPSFCQHLALHASEP